MGCQGRGQARTRAGLRCERAGHAAARWCAGRAARRRVQQPQPSHAAAAGHQLRGVRHLVGCAGGAHPREGRVNESGLRRGEGRQARADSPQALGLRDAPVIVPKLKVSLRARGAAAPRAAPGVRGGESARGAEDCAGRKRGQQLSRCRLQRIEPRRNAASTRRPKPRAQRRSARSPNAAHGGVNLSCAAQSALRGRKRPARPAQAGAPRHGARPATPRVRCRRPQPPIWPCSPLGSPMRVQRRGQRRQLQSRWSRCGALGCRNSAGARRKE